MFPRTRSSMDRAPDFESVGWGFESLRVRLKCDGFLSRFRHICRLMRMLFEQIFRFRCNWVQLFGEIKLSVISALDRKLVFYRRRGHFDAEKSQFVKPRSNTHWPLHNFVSKQIITNTVPAVNIGIILVS